MKASLVPQSHAPSGCWRSAIRAVPELRAGSGGHGRHGPHWHAEWQFCVIEEGDGWIERGRHRQPTPAKSWFVVRPGEVHANGCERPGCVWRNLLIDATWLEECGRSELGGTGVNAGPVEVKSEALVAAQLARLHRTLLAGDRLAGETALHAWCAAFLNNFIPGSANPAVRVHPAVVRVHDHLLDLPAEQPSLDELAKLAGLSPWRLVRVFTATYGMPPHAFQVQARIERAKQALRAGKTLITTALDAGFSDQSHFTRHFRRLVGITPGRYSRAMGKNVQEGTMVVG